MPSLRRLPRSSWLFVTEQLRHLMFVLFERFAPVKRGRWAFATWPGKYAHTLDNPRAVFEEVKHDASIEKVVLRKRGQDPSTVTAEGENVHFVEIESLRGAWMLATCEVLLTGYSLGSLCSYSRWLTTKHKIIQLWHGVPLKRIGKLFPGETHWDEETPKYAATVCSSERDQQIMAAAFSPLSVERTWLTGLPRNDLLLKDESRLPTDYRRGLERLRAMLGGRRLVLYAPTWREGSVGMYDFSAVEMEALRGVLRSHNAVLGIRAHSNRRPARGADTDETVLSLNDFPDVSVLLRETAVLVTDYSSIYIDFLVTDRPCVLFPYDIDTYVNERGFLYEYLEAIPARPVHTCAEFVTATDRALGPSGLDKERHFRCKSLFHGHTSESSISVVRRIRSVD